jgi:GT2 family glycosyltransferase
MNLLQDRFPKVYIITLNWNGKDDTLECLASLKKLDYPNYVIVVVDNGSIDGSASAIRAQFPEVTIIENRENLGYARGFNTGLQYAYEQGADYFLILNNDTIVDPQAVSELVKAAQGNEKIGFVTGKVYWYTKPEILQTVGKYRDPKKIVGGLVLVGSGEIDHGQYEKEQEYDFVDDVFLLVNREVYETVGGYDSHFFLYYEETDWCARVRKAGYSILFTPKARIWHKGNVGGPSIPSPLRQYYFTRNEIIFLKRNSPAPKFAKIVRLYLWEHTDAILRLIKHGKFKHASAHLRGISAGLWCIWQDSRDRKASTPPHKDGVRGRIHN